MKRIKYACLAQTIHFEPKEDLPHNEAAELYVIEKNINHWLRLH